MYLVFADLPVCFTIVLAAFCVTGYCIFCGFKHSREARTKFELLYLGTYRDRGVVEFLVVR